MRTSKRFWRCGLAICVATLALAGSATAQYTLFEVGKLSDPSLGEASFGVGIRVNQNGQVFGVSDLPDAGSPSTYDQRGFVWDWTNGIRDLGTIEFTEEAFFYDANDAGQAVGYCQTGSDRAFIWDATNGMKPLAFLEQSENGAFAINQAGQVVGWGATGTGNSHAVLWDPSAKSYGAPVDLGTLSGPDSTAYAINEAGQVVGTSDVSTKSAKVIVVNWGFLWDATSGMRGLEPLTGHSYSEAYSINANGLVAGNSVSCGKRAVVWDSAKSLTPTDLGVLGGIESWILGQVMVNGIEGMVKSINDAGQVIGGSDTSVPAEDHAFVWDEDNGMQDLGTLGGEDSAAYAINSLGQIVGSADTPSAEHAVLWNTNGGKAIEITDLNDYVAGSGWSLWAAAGINEDGDITGIGVHNSEYKAFLLRRTRYNLKVQVQGIGSVEPAPGDHAILEGTIVTLKATPSTGWTFAGWQGDVSATTSTTTVTMDGPKTVTAVFTENLPSNGAIVSLTTAASGSGTVIPVGTTYYTSGTAVEVYASPDGGWEFVKWTGDVTGSANPLKLTLYGDTSLTAVFQQSVYGPQCPLPTGTALPAGHRDALWVGLMGVAFLVMGLAIRRRRRAHEARAPQSR